MLRKAPRELWIALRVTLVLAAICGLIYPMVMTGIAQGLFNNQANGGLIKDASGTVVGANLIGQCFYETTRVNGTLSYRTTHFQGQTFDTVGPRYFQGRPSYTVRVAAGGSESVLPDNPPCNPASSGGSNLGPSNALLINRIDAYAAYLHSAGIDVSLSFTAAELEQAVTDPGRHCLSAGATTTPIPFDLVTGDFTGFDPEISPAAALAQVSMVGVARGIAPGRLTRLVNSTVTGRALGIFGEPVVDVLQLNLALNREFGPPPQLG